MTEIELMMTSILGCRRVDLFVDSRPLTGEQKIQLGRMEKRREQGEPLQYIVGGCDFMGIKLFVDPRVFIPRPETEILAEAAIRKMMTAGSGGRTLNVMDIGTGSGNIAIALAKNIRSCQVTAIDISGEALEVAARNAEKNAVADKINFIPENMLSFFKLHGRKASKMKFDFIVSNPPYIKTLQLDYLPRDVQFEPRAALDGGNDGLYFYRHIIEHSHQLLKDDGILLFEIGDGQRAGIEKIFKQATYYREIHFKKDYRGVDRIVIARNGSVKKGMKENEILNNKF